MSYSLTNTTFTTKNNSDIFSVNLPDTINEIYLHGYQKIDNDFHPEITWPSNLTFLETNFRPTFCKLPSSLKILSLITQNEILKKDLPENIEKLIISCPNAVPSIFYPQTDNYDFYKISGSTFRKYNVFVGGNFGDDDENDNTKYHKIDNYNY